MTVPSVMESSSSSVLRTSYLHKNTDTSEALLRKILDHFLIVDDRAVGIDPPGSVPLQLSVYCFHGTLHTEAEAGGFC